MMMWGIGGIAKSAYKEMFFYRHLKPELEKVGIRTPKAYYMGTVDYGKRNPVFFFMGLKSRFKALLMLEDLGKHKFYGMDNNLSLESALVVAKQLGQLHGRYWDDRSLKLQHPEVDLETNVYNIFFGLKSSWFYSYPSSKEKILQIVGNWGDRFPLLKDPQIRDGLLAMTELYPNLKKHFYPHVNEHGRLFSHSTLLHGDINSGNVFFVEDPTTHKMSDSILIDWQAYGMGHPSTEVSYLLAYVDADPVNDEKVMREYYEELTKTVPREVYPWNVFVREVELRNIGYMIWSMFILNDSPEKSQKRRKDIERPGINHTLMQQRVMSTNLKRFGYTFEKWHQQQLFENIEKNL